MQVFNKTILILSCILIVTKYKQNFFNKFEGMTYLFYILLIFEFKNKIKIVNLNVP